MGDRVEAALTAAVATNDAMAAASAWQMWGAGLFGAVVGWYIYYINRYRKDAVQLNDVLTLVAAIGGGTVLSLFDRKTDLFGAYGVGLGAGFFAYFLTLLGFVAVSKRFRVDWFLDARRKDPEPGWGYPGGGTGEPQRAMLVKRTLTGSPSGMPLAFAARSAAAAAASPSAAPEPIVDTRIEIREIARPRGASAKVVIGQGQPGAWIAVLDGVVVTSSHREDNVTLPGPLVGKVFEVSATMKAVIPEANRLSLQVTLFDDNEQRLGEPIAIEHPGETGASAALSIIVVFVEAA